MTEEKTKWESLKQLRDELKLHAHLFKNEVKDQWVHTEEKWENLSNKMHRTVDTAKDAGHDISDANKVLFQEVKQAYLKIKDTL